MDRSGPGQDWCAEAVLPGRYTRRGILVLDPKGDLVGDRLPLWAADRMALIDPTGSGPHPCLNILAQGDPELTVDNLGWIFRHLFVPSWGPGTDDVLRAACLTLLATARDRPPTLADVSQLLIDKVFHAARTVGLAYDRAQDAGSAPRQAHRIRRPRGIRGWSRARCCSGCRGHGVKTTFTGYSPTARHVYPSPRHTDPCLMFVVLVSAATASVPSAALNPLTAV